MTLVRGVVRSKHDENLACGQMVAPGETSDRVDPTDPHDEALIKDGVVILVSETEIKASPEAEEKAEELDIDINTVSGTGSNGFIKIGDVEDKAAEADETSEEDD